MSRASAVPLRHVEFCMGTAFSIDVRLPGVDSAALGEVVDWLHRVDETFSTYRPDSQISRLGRGELAVTDCAPEVREVLRRCAELEAETDGYFSAYASGALDPSGYVKGWTIEQASELLIAAGSRNHCVNGGGDVQCAGSAGSDQPWRIGIADPRNRDQLVGVAIGAGIAVATSGSAERGSHIVDPHDRSLPTGLLSVSVIGRRLSVVDAYATAAFAMGAGAFGWLSGLPGLDALIVQADGAVCSTAGAQLLHGQPSSTTV
ncbi:MAG: FAD:protein FMN transferase [Jatrophihabitantaceae bacterium]